MKFAVRLWRFDCSRRKTVLFTVCIRLSNEQICSEIIAEGVATTAAEQEDNKKQMMYLQWKKEAEKERWD